MENEAACSGPTCSSMQTAANKLWPLNHVFGYNKTCILTIHSFEVFLSFTMF